MGKFLFALGLMVIMMSCGKDIDQFIPRASQASTGNVDRLISRLHSDMAGDIVTTVSCPCSGDKAFKIDQDVVLVLPPDFVDLTQFPCPKSGFFDLHVTVCDTKGEILVSGLPTLSESKLLESRIELDIKVFNGQQNVKLAHGKQIRILVNDPDPRDRMELFYGENDEWIQADQNPDTWDNVENNDWWINLGSDTTQEIVSGFGYECLSDSMDWVNVDVFFEIAGEHRTPVCVSLPEVYTNRNTAVFMVFDNYKSILEMQGDSAQMQFCEPYGATPIGFNVTFVVLSEMGEDDYYFASKSTTIASGHIEVIEPRKTPYEEIKNYLNNL
jgi:hypothetical protein